MSAAGKSSLADHSFSESCSMPSSSELSESLMLLGRILLATVLDDPGSS